MDDDLLIFRRHWQHGHLTYHLTALAVTSEIEELSVIEIALKLPDSELMLLPNNEFRMQMLSASFAGRLCD